MGPVPAYLLYNSLILLSFLPRMGEGDSFYHNMRVTKLLHFTFSEILILFLVGQVVQKGFIDFFIL